jgi:hypothetical protein
MGAKGFYLPQDGHLVQLLTPKDYQAGAISSLVCRMGKYSHASIVISIGTAPRAAGIILVESCNNMTPTTHTDIAFTYYQCETAFAAAGGDVLSTAQVGPTTGLVPAAGTPNGVMYVVELDAAELVAGHIGFRISLADPVAASVISAIAILSGARYGMDESPTVIA